MRIFRDDEEFFIVVEELNSMLNISLLTSMSSNTINKSCYVRTTNLPLAILYCTKITKEHFLVFRVFSEYEQINSAKNGICFSKFSTEVFLFKKQEKFINFLCESRIIFLLDAWLRIFFCGSGLQAMTGCQTSN